MLEGRGALPCLSLLVHQDAGSPKSTVDVNPAEFTLNLQLASTPVEIRQLFEIRRDILSLANLLLRLRSFGRRCGGLLLALLLKLGYLLPLLLYHSF